MLLEICEHLQCYNSICNNAFKCFTYRMSFSRVRQLDRKLGRSLHSFCGPCISDPSKGLSEDTVTLDLLPLGCCLYGWPPSPVLGNPRSSTPHTWSLEHCWPPGWGSLAWDKASVEIAFINFIQKLIRIIQCPLKLLKIQRRGRRG